MPPGLLKSINEDKQDVVRVSAIHSGARLLTGAMGIPVMREDIAGSNLVNICMVGILGIVGDPTLYYVLWIMCMGMLLLQWKEVCEVRTRAWFLSRFHRSLISCWWGF